jgi:hypothetical protein
MERRDIIRPAGLVVTAAILIAALMLGPVGAIAAGTDTGPAAPAATPQSVTGTVVTLSPSPALLREVTGDGTVSNCAVWDVLLRTPGGPTVKYWIESPMAGTFPHLTVTDTSAQQRAHTLILAFSHQKSVAATLTYTPGDTVECGYSLENLVSAVALAVTAPVKKGQVTGVMTSLGPREMVSANGARCVIWAGQVSRGSQPVLFDVESPVTGGRASPGALKLVRTLAQAHRRRSSERVRLSYSGPAMACNTFLDRVATAVTVAG